MIYIKYLSLLFSLLIVQAQCRTLDYKYNGDEDHGEIVVFPTAGLRMIEAIVDVITNVSIFAINALSNAIGSLEEQLNNAEKVLINKIWDIAVAKLNEMEAGNTEGMNICKIFCEKVKNATSFTKATIQCTVEQGDYLKVVINDFVSKSITCDIEKTVMTLNTYVPLLTHIKDTNVELKNFTRQIPECGNDKAALPCMDELLEAMGKALAELGNSLRDDISDVLKFKEGINTSATLCHLNATTKMQYNFKELSNAISDCIQDKVIPKI